MSKKAIMTPKIALTAKDMTGDENECIKPSCDDYLAKPFMLAKVSKYLIQDVLLEARQMS